MTSYNKVIIAGNLTRDIELRHLSSGAAVCDMSVAINEKRKDQSGQLRDEVTYADVSLIGITAENASNHLRKGSSVLVEGRLKTDSWEKDGKKMSKLKVVCERLQYLDSRQSRQEQFQPERSQDQTQEPTSPTAPPPSDDIPF